MKPETNERGGGQPGDAFVPTQDWLRAFRSQWTPELIEAVHRYARVQARKVALVRRVDAPYAEDLVQDIVGDTLMGVIRWDPARVSLRKHILDAIKSRTRHAYLHALHFRPVRLDENLDEAEATLDGTNQAMERAGLVAADALTALRSLAVDDLEITKLLGAYDQLVTKRFAVMKLTNLTSKQYDAARKRLKRLVDQLPSSPQPSTAKQRE